MKRYIALILALLTLVSLSGCKEENIATTESAPEKQRIMTCAVGYPILEENGYLTPTNEMKDYPGARTLEDVLKSGFNAGVEVTFDDEGYIASIGALKAEGGNKFVVISISSNGHHTYLEEKPADIVLQGFDSYQIIYADPDGKQITIIE